jgi:hypothetical protein
VIERGTVIVRNPRVAYRKLAEGGGAVLLNLDTSAYHGLNQTGSAIWESVGDGKTFGDLVPDVASYFDDAPPSLPTDVAAFIEDLLQRDLLRVDHGHPAAGPDVLGAADRGSE